MEKKYTFDEEDKKENVVREPAIAYNSTPTTAYTCQHTIEELRDKFDRAVKQVKVGDVLTHEEVKNRYKK